MGNVVILDTFGKSPSGIESEIKALAADIATALTEYHPMILSALDATGDALLCLAIECAAHGGILQIRTAIQPKSIMVELDAK